MGYFSLLGHRRLEKQKENSITESVTKVPSPQPKNADASNTPVFNTTEPLQAHFEPLIHSMQTHRASIPGLSKGRMPNWRMRSMDNSRLSHGQPTNPSTSQVEVSVTSDTGVVCGGSTRDISDGDTTCSEMERTPLEVLMRMDPKQIVNILRQSTEAHRKAMGTRHKCTPSVRWRHCTYHCVQILSARALALMSHSNIVQHHIVNDGHIKILVEALDPNHDPVSKLLSTYVCRRC